MTTTIPCHAKNPHTCRYHGALIRAQVALTAGDLDAYLAENTVATEAAKTDRDVQAFFTRQAKIPAAADELKPASLAGVQPGDTPVQALAKLNARHAELAGMTAPARGEQNLIWEQIKEQTTLRWQQEPPHDYVGENDGAGFHELINDAWNNTGASDYKRAYMKSLLGDYARSDGYNTLTMAPSIDVTLPYVPDEEKLTQLSDGLTRYAKFVTDHEDAWVGEQPDGRLGAYEWQEYKAAGERYVTVALSSPDGHESGIPQVRIYADGSAVRCFTRYSHVYPWAESKYGGQIGDYSGDVNTQVRRPLIDVLRASSKDWYYPAESNPNYRKPEYNDYNYDDGY